ncbi:MAG: hypothetical protein HY541_05710 [Deltaproteobacteria bacterium]|nr:hypothetical protein [Deltaproteobacteria bacterium]
MTRTQTISVDFRQASLSMREHLDRLREDVSALHLSSIDLFHNLKQKLLSSWKNREQVIREYKLSLQAMPKELRRRSLVSKLSRDLEDFEADMKRYLSEIRESSFQDFRKSFHRRIDEMADRVAGLERHPLVQKFLRGEAVLASRKNIQWRRKLAHAFNGIFFIYLFVYSGLPKAIIWTLAGGFIVWALSLETARHINPKINRWVCRWFAPIMREREKTSINSAIFYIVSMAVVYFTCPIEVSQLTMLFIAIGDPVAGIVGVTWGKTKITSHVSVEGSLACFAACAGLAAICAGFLFEKTLPLPSLVLFSGLSGIVGAFAEASFKRLDDNLVMPLLSAPALWGLMKFFSLL